MVADGTHWVVVYCSKHTCSGICPPCIPSCQLAALRKLSEQDQAALTALTALVAEQRADLEQRATAMAAVGATVARLQDLAESERVEVLQLRDAQRRNTADIGRLNEALAQGKLELVAWAKRLEESEQERRRLSEQTQRDALSTQVTCGCVVTVTAAVVDVRVLSHAEPHSRFFLFSHAFAQITTVLTRDNEALTHKTTELQRLADRLGEELRVCTSAREELLKRDATIATLRYFGDCVCLIPPFYLCGVCQRSHVSDSTCTIIHQPRIHRMPNATYLAPPNHRLTPSSAPSPPHPHHTQATTRESIRG
jgi:hypothetical protein